MSLLRCLIALVLVPAALPSLGSRRAGWLDRVVLYHKQKLFNELKELAPIKISAEIQQKPVGYVDSTQWDYDSVQRLLTLISASETAKPVHKALRRMLQPTRRLMMSMKESKQRFPSIKPDNNEFYYDGYSSAEEHELPAPPPVPEDQVVLVVSNPVEARLPSARISVKLLRDILEARARAARQMPTPETKPWLDFIRTQTRFSSTTTTTTGKPADKPEKNDQEETTVKPHNDAEMTTTAADNNSAKDLVSEQDSNNTNTDNINTNIPLNDTNTDNNNTNIPLDDTNTDNNNTNIPLDDTNTDSNNTNIPLDETPIVS